MSNSTSMKEFATTVVKQLRDSGHVAFFAGGCVRDQLLGVAPKDYDVATSALPEVVRTVFGHRRTIAIGQSFGVITVLGPKPHQVEVATFRADGEYSDGRHPDAVTFSTPEEDAARRDFTINGMFFDPVAGEVIDFVGGKQDLAAQLIRAIGSPHERIEEDRLRMLRAVRFASTYDFAVESATLKAVQDQCGEISAVSQERISHELQRMLCHRNRRNAMSLLRESGLLEHVTPEVYSVAGDDSRWQRLMSILDRLQDPPFAVVLSALLGTEGAALTNTAASEVCRRMKLSNETRKSVEWTLKHAAALVKANDLPFSELQPLLIAEPIREALKLQDAVVAVDGADTQHINHCREKLALPQEALDPPPLVRGEDLAAAGIPPGPEYARLLKLVRVAQLDDKISTVDDAIELVQQHASG